MPNRPTLSRRNLMKLSVASLLSANLWPGALFAEDAPAGEAFKFIVVNDLHAFDDKCAPYFERVVDHMRKTDGGFDLCLIVGDLADQALPAQHAMVHDIFAKLERPIHVVIGNHDHATMEDSRSYEQAYPNSINYSFEHKGWQFVGMDSSEGNKSAVAVQKPTLDWLDTNLPRLDRKRPTVLFSHFPFGLKAPLRVANADDVLARFKEINLRAVFNGHFHGFTEAEMGNFVATTNRCCSVHRNNHDKSKEKGYFLCTAAEGKITREFVEVQVPA